MDQDALIIVDMQAIYPASRNKKTIEAVIKLIEQFMEEQKPIIVLEYAVGGHDAAFFTHESITNMLQRYNKRTFKTKRQDDGSEKVLEVLYENRIKSKIKKVLLCGVNGSACVVATYRGLLKQGISAVVSSSATNCAWPDWKTRFPAKHLVE